MRTIILTATCVKKNYDKNEYIPYKFSSTIGIFLLAKAFDGALVIWFGGFSCHPPDFLALRLALAVTRMKYWAKSNNHGSFCPFPSIVISFLYFLYLVPIRLLGQHARWSNDYLEKPIKKMRLDKRSDFNLYALVPFCYWFLKKKGEF